ncbi:HBR165Wp [Eremothecium sinecaudum]|uniref:FAD synthase n=1 Tax=Eremothecium sinecaudum TaxID=45286 RepID=A0A120K177_9SACH|nr:HBR165Wp [Eremothecium sinecaudum]AMD19066.1 HBR165Wp [Eremothecium sinecaudum]
MTYSLHLISQHCYNITASYLSIKCNNPVIQTTQNAITLTRLELLNNVLPCWNPFNGQISFSYNGGKDCQVLLIIYLSCLWEFFLDKVSDSQYDQKYHSIPLKKLPAVYIHNAQNFESLEHFIGSSVERYGLSLYESPKESAINMPQAFTEYLELFPNTKAIIIGIRHTDPYAENLKTIHKTDSNWPEFIRVQPLLHWDLENIWSFLLYSGEEICGLYSLGFTSLGSMDRTVRNPNLRIREDDSNSADQVSSLKNPFEWEIQHAYGKLNPEDKVNLSPITSPDREVIMWSSNESYYPGWYLTDNAKERAGRH